MKTMYTFTRNGLGDAPEGLRQALAVKFLSLLAQEEQLPAAILFYTEGVKLVVEGSPVINWLEMLQGKGVELIICSTCLEYFGLKDQVRVGRMAGMPDIIAAMQNADKVVPL